MRKVTLKISEGTENVMIEGRRPGQLDTWLRIESRDLVAGDKEQEFTLQKGQRLVIGDNSQEELVYDPDQKAAVRPSQQENEEGRADKAAEASEEQKKLAAQKQEQEEARKKAEAERGAQANPEANKKDPTTKGIPGAGSTDPGAGLASPSGNHTSQPAPTGMKSSNDVKGK